MRRTKTPPPNKSDWNCLPIEVRIYIFLRLYAATKLPHLKNRIVDFLYRVDLWLFPPLAFASAYLVASKYFPPHPMIMFAILATSFMFSALVLFIIRPPKRRRFHWVKINER